MSKTKKTQPVKAAKTTAKKPATKKAASRKDIPKAAPSAGADMAAFATLWQQKWGELLQEKGWPEQAAMPSIGQMPFMFPFMIPGMASAPPAPMPTPPAPSAIDAATLQVLIQRIAQLEHRIMELEHQLLQRNAKKEPKSKR